MEKNIGKTILEKAKYALQKINNHKYFKNKPLVLAAILAGTVTIGGIGVAVSCAKKSEGDYKNVNKSTENLLSEENSTVNKKYDFELNLNDCDQVLTPSFKEENISELNNIDSCEIDDNRFNLGLQSSDDAISASMDGALLIDVDPIVHDGIYANEEIGHFNNVIINNFSELQDLSCSSVLIEKVNGIHLFVADTIKDNNASVGIVTEEEASITSTAPRYVGTSNNLIPYRIVTEEYAKNAYPTFNGNYYLSGITIDGKQKYFSKVYGERTVIVDGVEYQIVCGKFMGDRIGSGEICEFLVDKTIYFTSNNFTGNEKPIAGKAIINNEGGKTVSQIYDSTGESNLISNMSVERAILGNDGYYYVLAKRMSDRILLKISSKHLNYEFWESEDLILNSEDNTNLNDYYYTSFNQASYEMPISYEGCSLVKEEGGYYYAINNASFVAPNTRVSDYPTPSTNFGAIYSPYYVVLLHHVEEEDLTDYVIAPSQFEYVITVGGESLTNNHSYAENYAYKKKNIAGLNYLSLISKNTDFNTGEQVFIETLVLEECVNFKGKESVLILKK